MDGAHQGKAHERAQHQGFALAEIEGAGSGKGQLVAEGDDGIDHAQRDAAEDELQEDFHGIPRKTKDEKMASPDSSRLATARRMSARLISRGRLCRP
ncbi:hypothetical protein D3C81_1828720 [compost metagenome]